MSPSGKKSDLLIVGAGISGLTLASALKDRNLKIAILEKSRGLGGRVASRREEGVVFDHGAQFYKASPSHQPFWHSELLQKGVIKEWSVEGSERCFVGHGAMTQIPKNIPHAAEVFLNEKVLEISKQGNDINVKTENGANFQSRYLILTAPLPQALELLQNSKIVFPASLGHIAYDKALVGLFRIAQERGPEIVFKDNINESLFSVGNQKSKGTTNGTSAYTVVMNPGWSERYFYADEAEALFLIRRNFEEWMRSQGVQLEVASAQLKKWRYCKAQEQREEPFIQLASFPEIFLAGDAFGVSSSVRSTSESALQLAQYLKSILSGN